MNHYKKQEALWTSPFVMLCLINFSLFMSFFILLPTLPLYITEELHAREEQVGLIIGIFTIAAVLSRPLTGYYMDQADQKKVYFLAITFFVLTTAGYLFTSSILLFLLVRFLHGFGFGMSTTAGGTLAAEWIPESRRGEGIGYFGTFVMVAMAVGPIAGVYIADQYGYLSMFSSCLFLSLVGLLLALLIRSPQKEKKKQKQKQQARMALSTLFEQK